MVGEGGCIAIQGSALDHGKNEFTSEDERSEGPEEEPDDEHEDEVVDDVDHGAGSGGKQGLLRIHDTTYCPLNVVCNLKGGVKAISTHIFKYLCLLKLVFLRCRPNMNSWSFLCSGSIS